MIDAHPDPEIPDSYYAEYDPNAGWQGNGGSEFGGSEAYEDPGSVAPSGAEEWGEEGMDVGDDEGEGGEEEEEEDDGEGDGGLDEYVSPFYAEYQANEAAGSWQQRSWSRWRG